MPGNKTNAPEDDTRVGSFAFQILLILLGGVLIVAGFIIPPEHILHQMYVHEVSKILGTLFVGLGFTGYYEVTTMGRADRNLRSMLASHLDEYPHITRQLFLDHIESSDIHLEVPERYRTTLYVYHQTGALLEGEVKTIWVKEQLDFSRELTKRTIFTRTESRDPRPHMPTQTYAAQLVLQRGKIIISNINETDTSEPVSLYIMDIPTLSDISYGLNHHMDWQGKHRISRTIFSFRDLELDAATEGPKLEKLWEQGMAQKYLVTL